MSRARGPDPDRQTSEGQWWRGSAPAGGVREDRLGTSGGAGRRSLLVRPPRGVAPAFLGDRAFPLPNHDSRAQGLEHGADGLGGGCQLCTEGGSTDKMAEGDICPSCGRTIPNAIVIMDTAARSVAGYVPARISPPDPERAHRSAGVFVGVFPMSGFVRSRTRAVKAALVARTSTFVFSPLRCVVAIRNESGPSLSVVTLLLPRQSSQNTVPTCFRPERRSLRRSFAHSREPVDRARTE